MSAEATHEETQSPAQARPVLAPGIPASAAFAASIGNRGMSQLMRSPTGTGTPPVTVANVLQGAMAVADRESPQSRDLLARTLSRVERDPGFAARHAPVGARPVARCACGGATLPGGECTSCMAKRLTTQGMPRQEVQRMVLARTKAGTRQLARTRSFMGCLNSHLASFGVAWALIAVVGSACGAIGAVAGLAGGPAAPATSPSAAAVAAATCICALTGASFGLVITAITQCVANPDGTHPWASTD